MSISLKPSSARALLLLAMTAGLGGDVVPEPMRRRRCPHGVPEDETCMACAGARSLRTFGDMLPPLPRPAYVPPPSEPSPAQVAAEAKRARKAEKLEALATKGAIRRAGS